MAAKQDVFDSLRKETECSFCIHTMKQPKSLPCLHSFCLKCLNKYAVSRRREGYTTFDCPVCLKTLQLPDNNRFDAFPTAFHINRLVDIRAENLGASEQENTCDNCDKAVCATYCLECRTFMCFHCLSKHNRLEVNRAHRLLSHPVCQHWEQPKQHGKKEPLNFYCRECCVSICKKCRYSKHKRHWVTDIRYATEQCKMEISQAVDEMKSRLSKCKEEFETDEKYLNESEEQIQSSREKVQAKVEELMQALKEHEVTTVKELDDLHQTQQEAHLAHKEKYELLSTQINSFTDYAEAVLKRNNAVEIFQAQATAAQQCDELLGGETVKASNRLSVDFLPNNESCNTVRNMSLGRLFQSRITDPSRSEAEGRGLYRAELFHMTYFKVMTKDAEGKTSYWQDDCVTVSIETDSGIEVNLGSKITNNKDGTYVVSYYPHFVNVEHYNISVKVNGYPLAGNPRRVVVCKLLLFVYFLTAIAFLMVITFIFVMVLLPPPGR